MLDNPKITNIFLPNLSESLPPILAANAIPKDWNNNIKPTLDSLIFIIPVRKIGIIIMFPDMAKKAKNRVLTAILKVRLFNKLKFIKGLEIIFSLIINKMPKINPKNKQYIENEFMKLEISIFLIPKIIKTTNKIPVIVPMKSKFSNLMFLLGESFLSKK